jgi:hypothetical protein
VLLFCSGFWPQLWLVSKWEFKVLSSTVELILVRSQHIPPQKNKQWYHQKVLLKNFPMSVSMFRQSYILCPALVTEDTIKKLKY